MKATPPPWFIGGEHRRGVLVLGEAPSVGGVLVADVAAVQGPDVARANATLIAAAPDMLAALIAAEEDLDEVPGRDDPPSLAAVRAAIAKARGGGP